MIDNEINFPVLLFFYYRKATEGNSNEILELTINEGISKLKKSIQLVPVKINPSGLFSQDT